VKVFIPKKNTSLFNLYCYSRIKQKFYIKDKGSSLTTSGIAFLIYKYPNYRRGYLIREFNGICEEKSDVLPSVYSRIKILAMVEGRKIDEWKFLLYRLQQEYGNSIYSRSDNYWLRTNLYLDERIRNMRLKKIRNKKTGGSK